VDYFVYLILMIASIFIKPLGNVFFHDLSLTERPAKHEGTHSN
jgi:hypothetical protein